MKFLDNDELMSINGGGFNFGIIIGISAAITFIIGIIDGYLRPLVCRK